MRYFLLTLACACALAAKQPPGHEKTCPDPQGHGKGNAKHCNPQPPPPTGDPLPQNVWVMAFGTTASGVTQIPPSGGSFFFPTYQLNGDTSNYFVHSVTGPISGTLTISLSVTTSGAVTWHKDDDPSNVCDTPPTARLFFSSAIGAADGSDTHRWWAGSGIVGGSYVLGDGSAILSMPLQPENWSDVNGQVGNTDATTLAGFADALANARYVGLTFGGGCFFGHGVSVSGGTAKLEVQNYSVQ